MGHPLNAEEYYKWLKEYAQPIAVGNNVWIGGNVVVLTGVTIGDNTVISARSVVSSDIPNDVLAFSNPYRVIKEI
ncbi:MAG: DapH/DapD/GlmU-related protein [Mangrovibacterium sp.]